MNTRKISTGLSALLLIATSVWAQQPNTVQRYESIQTTPTLPQSLRLNLSTNTEAPELFPGENADVGSQRILKLIPRRKYFEIAADSQYLYTDNPFLTQPTKAPTSLFVNTIQAAFAPDPYFIGKDQFAPSVGFRSQWFNYDLLDGAGDGLNSLDFNAQTAFINARYQKGLWQYFLGFEFIRLVDQPGYHEAYREYTPTIGVQRFVPITDNLIFAAGLQLSYHLTQLPEQNLPKLDVNDRYDGIINLSLNYEAVPKLFLQPYYRFQYTFYPNFADLPSPAPSNKRNDVINTFGTAVVYYFNQNVAVRLFASYEMKASSFSTVYNYHKLDAGGGLSLNFRF